MVSLGSRAPVVRVIRVAANFPVTSPRAPGSAERRPTFCTDLNLQLSTTPQKVLFEAKEG